MTPELKTKWLDALRSGNYTQGRHTMRDPRDNSFCCLGVLCDIAGYKWEHLIKDDENSDFQCPAGMNFIEDSEEMEKLGLSPKIHTIAYSMNDGTLNGLEEETLNSLPHLGPYTFSEIADWLEKNL